jgi:hypothetical protein
MLQLSVVRLFPARVCSRVTREDFFGSLPDRLMKLAGLTRAYGIPTAKVPILTIEVRRRGMRACRWGCLVCVWGGP